MQEEKIIVERNTRTVSPPLFSKERNASLGLSNTKKDFHERNLESIKVITDKNFQKIQQMEEEKRKLEITRQRLAQKVLKRNAETKGLSQAKNEDFEQARRNTCSKLMNVQVIKEEDEYKDDLISNNTAKIDHKTRNITYIQNLQDSNKAKVQQKEEKELKKLNNMKKLRENFGLHNVSSKLSEFEDRKSLKPQEIKEEEKRVIQKPKEEEKEREKEKGKGKGKEKEKEKKLKDEDRLPQKFRREEPTAEMDDKKKTKRSDEESFQRLIQQPKRFTGMPIITDMGVFKKKNSLSDKDRIFIINGCYPDIRKALLKRSKLYTGRLV